METPHGFPIPAPKANDLGGGRSTGVPAPSDGFCTFAMTASAARRTMHDCIRFSNGNVWVFVTLSDEAWDELERIVRHRGYDEEAEANQARAVTEITETLGIW